MEYQSEPNEEQQDQQKIDPTLLWKLVRQMENQSGQHQKEQQQEQQNKINPNLLWKLARQRYQLCFTFCRPCGQRLFEAKNTNFLIESNGSIRANFVMCHDCARSNMRAGDAYAQPTNGGGGGQKRKPSMEEQSAWWIQRRRGRSNQRREYDKSDPWFILKITIIFFLIYSDWIKIGYEWSSQCFYDLYIYMVFSGFCLNI